MRTDRFPRILPLPAKDEVNDSEIRSPVLGREAGASVTMSPRRRGWLLAIALELLVVAVGVAKSRSLSAAPLDAFSYDSFRYLAGAESLLRTGRYRGLAGEAQTTWTPGTSLLYAATSRLTGLGSERLVAAIGIASYLLLAASCAAFLRRTVRRPWLGTLAFATICFNGFILSVTGKLWSDLIALGLLMTSLAFLHFARTDAARGTASFVAAATSASLAMLVRSAMLALSPLLILVAFEMFRRRHRIAPIIAAVCAPLAALAVTRLLSGPAAGARPLAWRAIPAGDDWGGFVSLAQQIFPSQLEVWAGVAFLGLAVALPVRMAVRSPRDERSGAIVLLFVWLVCYGAFLLLAQAVWSFPVPVLDLRMLIPLFPPAVLAMALAADGLFDRSAWKGAVLGAVLAVALIRAGRGIAAHGESGTERQCVERNTIVRDIRSLAPHILPGPVLSNAQGLTWYALRRPVHAQSDAAGATFILVDAERACPNTVESDLTTTAPVVASRGTVHVHRAVNRGTASASALTSSAE